MAHTRERIKDRPVGCLAAYRIIPFDSDPSETIRWAFPAFYSDRQIRVALENDCVEVDGRRCQHEYDCCGRWYCGPIQIKRRPSRSIVIVRQHYYVNC